MKSWKEAPHLFWEFDCMSIEEKTNKKCIHTVSWILSNDLIGYKNNWLEDCQLMARRISDMTDEERNEYDDFLGLCHYNPNTFDVVEAGQDLFLYLLSIGVYPFDQEAFETGEVLDAKEVS